MKLEEHSQILSKITGLVQGTEVQAEVNNYLSELSVDYEAITKDSETKDIKIDTLSKNNEKLRESNMDLLLQIPTFKGNKVQTTGIESQGEEGEEGEPKKREFKDLWEMK